MANPGSFNQGAAEIFEPGAPFNAGGPGVTNLQESHEDLKGIVAKQGAVIAEHQGTLKGVFPAISAVQASLGAWLSVAAVVTALLLGLVIFNLTRTGAVGDSLAEFRHNETQEGARVEVRLGALENEVRLVPERVAAELRRSPTGQPPVNP